MFWRRKGDKQIIIFHQGLHFVYTNTVEGKTSYERYINMMFISAVALGSRLFI